MVKYYFQDRRLKYLPLSIMLWLNLLFFFPVHAIELPGALVDSEWLMENKDQVVILDVRQDIKSYLTKPVFMRNKSTGKLKLIKVGGHIPGAVLVDYKYLRAKRKIDGLMVSRMLPMKADFEKLMQQSGVNQDSAIVIVSKGQSSSDMTIATRLYWQLKYYGHDNMSVLNGGMSDWLANMYPISLESGKLLKGNWLAKEERKQILATSLDVEKALTDSSAQLIDNRTLDLYLGTHKKSYVYKKGHIPGAKVLPHDLLTTNSVPSRFLSNGKLRKITNALNIDEGKNTITYCNSGHLASGGWFILSELLGNHNVKLYDGSMHEWTIKEQRPVTSMKME